MRVEELPLISVLEDVCIAELDRQYLNDEIAPTSTGESWFSAIDGEISGIPDWHALMAAVYNALKEEGML